MVTIKKGNHKLIVSKETYINMFKELGYEIVTKSEDKNKKKKNETTSKEKGKVEETQKSQIDEFLDNVCDEDKDAIKEKEKVDTTEEKEVSDILSIMSKDKNKQNKK